MQTFKVRHWESLESPAQEPCGGVVEPGFTAPGRMVLVVREGTAWVRREDKTRESVGAKGVVMYDAGDWIEYGSDGSGGAFQAELYGAAGFPGSSRQPGWPGSSARLAAGRRVLPVRRCW
jgi:hypothetical protein